MWCLLTNVLLLMFTVVDDICPKESSIRVKHFFLLVQYAF